MKITDRWKKNFGCVFFLVSVLGSVGLNHSINKQKVDPMDEPSLVNTKTI